jgi:hypothetical protein
MTSMPDRRDENEQSPQDDLAEAKTEHAANRVKARESRAKIREIKRERRAKTIAHVTDKAAPVTRGGLMVAGTASIVAASAQLMSGDSSGAANWLSAGISCWALALLHRRPVNGHGLLRPRGGRVAAAGSGVAAVPRYASMGCPVPMAVSRPATQSAARKRVRCRCAAADPLRV